MIDNRKQIQIRVPSFIIESTELNPLEKIVLSLNYTYLKRLGYNSKTNKELAEMLSVDLNSLSKHRKNLQTLGYEVKMDGKYYLTDKVTKRSHGGRVIILPPEVYTLKLVAGAKLLFAEYNSLSQGDKKKCFAKRSFLAERLNCNEDSITNWFNKLSKLGLIAFTILRPGSNSKQRVVVTEKFRKIKKQSEQHVEEEKDTSSELKSHGETKELDTDKLKGMINKSMKSIDHSDDKVIWRKYLSDVQLYELRNNIERETCILAVCEKIEEAGDDKILVLTSLKKQVSEKLEKVNGVELLLNDIQYFIDE